MPDFETFSKWCELLSYLVTVVGLPLAIYIFVYEQRKERKAEEGELYQRLSDEYSAFLRLALDNADLHLLGKPGGDRAFTEEQQERRFAIFGILVSLFERAYILVYDDPMDKQTRRLWQSWEDYMREWCRREDFRAAMQSHLEGEDEDFRRHIQQIAVEVSAPRSK